MEELEVLQEEQGPAARRDAQGSWRPEVQKTSAPRDVPVLEEPEVFQKEQETPTISGSQTDSVVLKPRIPAPVPVLFTRPLLIALLLWRGLLEDHWSSDLLSCE